MIEKSCPYGPNMDPRLLIFSEENIWDVSYNLYPACPNHLVLSPVEYYPEITDLTYAQVKSFFFAVKRLILFFESDNFLLFWFKGIGRKFKYFHAHFMPLIPAGFREIEGYPILSFIPGIGSIDQVGTNEGVLRNLFEVIRVLRDREDYTTVWREGRGISPPAMMFFARKADDGLFSRSEEEKKFRPTSEEVFRWARELRKQIRGG